MRVEGRGGGGGVGEQAVQSSRMVRGVTLLVLGHIMEKEEERNLPEDAGKNHRPIADQSALM